MEQPLGERRPDELRVGRHPVQREDMRHQRRHPPRVIPPDDTSPTEAVGLQEHDGLEEVAHPLLLLDRWPPTAMTAVPLRSGARRRPARER